MSKIIVVGLGRSGISLLDYYSDRYEMVFAYENNQNIDISKFKKYENSNNINFFLGENPTGDEEADIVYLSPGISPNEDFAQKFIQRDICVTNEIELAYSIAKDANFIGITGTNGKTTTTSMLGDIYKKYDENTYVVGNIGNAVLSSISLAKTKANFITELSSYQLETIVNFRVHIAVILNITPDHLSRHKTMENYKNAKYNITKNQIEGDFLVLNKDDESIDINLENVKSKVIYFSMKEKLKNGVYYDTEKGSIISTINRKEEEIIKVKDIHLLGKHNIQNTLACVTVSILDNIPTALIAEAIKDFKAVKHRLQKVREVDDVIYVNDSKGTNIDSTLKAIESIDNDIILIAGGYDKMLEFDDLIKGFNGKVKTLLLFGATKKLIRDTALKYDYKDIISLKNLKQCVQIAKIIAQKGDVVLLSPACASWDMYQSFEERGDEFIELVNNLK
ncbi:UDP-N-acetylmuramoyl-L-alanine--D-glutamate ligase [Peptoanaerobacter stomatis]|uniref:UDP-N-acetylmuramoylalanine--D-glutamate ligase n=1 Tax=Peptoanaerobacter stomatis TaxID=796937 RepID=J4W154_9FIRM|nr:UDP-N-acetylmuramoyl-L-alanine--D-glutamate ligase [Peptoanaerobacter stomatis]EJU20011.1 UDP-N-acetylmuramoyl-L-alanine--D-glutamate ligase [Peptoanaerobacter stomatis]NWO25103.1 UDP-N-acetylmuramoyl-L-alanine--D-glutamate ligase [Peptostreptococcaceae bacterium oral taxon 081]